MAEKKQNKQTEPELVEQFERMKERDNAELSPTPAWQWEKGMLQTADILSSKKAEYLVLRWAQMVNASVLEVKDEWLRRFGDAQPEEDRTAKEMLERYVVMAEEHMNKLFSLADEYSKKRCTSVGQQSGTVWHPKTERPKDESQILIDEGDGCGMAGQYYADDDMLAAAADGIAADWENWHMDRWAYISDLVPKKEKEDGV